MNFGFTLLDKEYVGSIELNNKVRISDPCYDIDTWCAGTLENVLEGKYNCYMQRVDCCDWGIRVASIEVKHKDYLHIEPDEVQNIDVGVDSGQAGIYDLDYFIKNREDKNGDDTWYCRVCDSTYKYTNNPQYLPFKETEWWNDEFKEIHKFIKTEEFSKSIDTKIALAYWEAYEKYMSSVYFYKEKSMLTASTLDNKCLVSSSGDGDGSYICFVGRNKEGQIVSIKVDYYYGYDEDEE